MGEITGLCWCLEGMSKHMLWMTVCGERSLNRVKGKARKRKKERRDTMEQIENKMVMDKDGEGEI